jgi:hypothetical protein
MTRRLVGALGTALLVAVASGWLAQPAVSAGADDIGGTVVGDKGPEAGVWVIAETTELSTKFIKIVVTNDAGRFLIPDLPFASYQVWVRGYGLADSAKKPARPGETVSITVKNAASPKEAAQIYPASYWYSLLQLPPDSDFPGTGQGGNGIAPGMRTQAHWIDRLKDGCELCHQMGNKATREMPMLDRSKFPSSGAIARLRCTPTGAIASPPGKSRRRRRGPAAANATWC